MTPLSLEGEGAGEGVKEEKSIFSSSASFQLSVYYGCHCCSASNKEAL